MEGIGRILWDFVNASADAPVYIPLPPGAPLVASFLKDHPMKYNVALGSPQMTERFHLNLLPTTVVFDRSGKALQRFEGFTRADLLESAVKTAL